MIHVMQTVPFIRFLANKLFCFVFHNCIRIQFDSGTFKICVYICCLKNSCKEHKKIDLVNPGEVHAVITVSWFILNFKVYFLTNQ